MNAGKENKGEKTQFALLVANGKTKNIKSHIRNYAKSSKHQNLS